MFSSQPNSARPPHEPTRQPGNPPGDPPGNPPGNPPGSGLGSSPPKKNAQSANRLIETCSQLALALGILVRLVQYFSNRSLWFDEVAVALNLQERNYSELLGALSYDQAAPPLFLWIEEFALNTFGNNEFSLRLYPLLAGLLSLFVFYHFTKLFTARWARPIAIFIFSVQSYFIYFSAELKPYSSDVCVGLLLFMAVGSLASLRPSAKRLWGVGALGVVSIWLSFPSILMMAAIEATNLIRLKVWQLRKSDWQALLARRLPLYAAWLISLVGLYVGVVSKTLTETDLSESWANRYPSGWLDLFWMVDAMGQFFYRPLGFLSPADGIAIALFLVGIISLYRTRKWHLAYLSSPFIVTMLASYLHVYPFRDRLILFLVPYGLAILAEGIAVAIRRWQKRPRLVGILGLLLAVSLLVLPLQQTLPQLIQPSRTHFDEMRPAIAYIHQNWQPGDKIFVFRWSQLQFQYYRTRYEFDSDDVFLSGIEDFGLSHLKDNDIERLSKEITELKAGPLKGEKRVWFLMARKNDDAAEAIMQGLDQLSEPLEMTRYPTVVVSLRDLSK
ncbi:MAG: Dolichyl-phosphate-mannose-protein mannosyltransferase [Phormidesmis priestleyi Ana]|uniref:Dolichyl-phosphate-mannose-protein mannosyltransferase n=1 Tax=Phormidesmis priestleyi Ana TaxID=1666911 RepID=A0A0P8DH32_9CYAN|nr:MAG: Dolichyl-phosphate-mannose-protein mannosyltransferase [Phormidesmis priestleyi Ana]